MELLALSFTHTTKRVYPSSPSHSYSFSPPTSITLSPDSLREDMGVVRGVEVKVGDSLLFDREISSEQRASSTLLPSSSSSSSASLRILEARMGGRVKLSGDLPSFVIGEEEEVLLYRPSPPLLLFSQEMGGYWINPSFPQVPPSYSSYSSGGGGQQCGYYELGVVIGLMFFYSSKFPFFLPPPPLPPPLLSS